MGYKAAQSYNSKLVLMISQSNMYGYRSEMEHLDCVKYCTGRLILIRYVN